MSNKWLEEHKLYEALFLSLSDKIGCVISNELIEDMKSTILKVLDNILKDRPLLYLEKK